MEKIINMNLLVLLSPGTNKYRRGLLVVHQ